MKSFSGATLGEVNCFEPADAPAIDPHVAPLQS